MLRTRTSKWLVRLSLVICGVFYALTFLRLHHHQRKEYRSSAAASAPHSYFEDFVSAITPGSFFLDSQEDGSDEENHLVRKAPPPKIKRVELTPSDYSNHRSSSPHKNANTPGLVTPNSNQGMHSQIQTNVSRTKDGSVVDVSAKRQADSRIEIPWLDSYRQWHKQQQSQLNHTNWEQHKYLIVRCHAGDKCGGAADRLLPIPTLLRISAESQRLLFISWQRPGKLQEFLLPTKEGGIDWRVPEFLMEKIPPHYEQTLEHITELSQSSQTILVTKYQSLDYGAPYYNQRLAASEPDWEHAFSTIWNVLFTPAPEIRKRIEGILSNNGLTPSLFQAAHLRAYHDVEERDTKTLQLWTRNAIDCASNLRSSTEDPIFFASDCQECNHMAVEYGTSHNVKVAARKLNKQPLHLDKDAENEDYKVSDFHTVFLDVFLMGLSHCVTRGRGGYGYWGMLLANQACDMPHMTNDEFVGCNWKEPPTTIAAARSPSKRHEPFFPDPIKIPKPPKLQDLLDEYFLENGSPYSGKLWEKSQYVPAWMKEYFEWNAEQRKMINENNWKNHRFLVMQCLSSLDEKCGGTADRLKPFLSLLKLAHKSKRILLIYWDRPARLEEYLLPPVGGVDWRVPAWLEAPVRILLLPDAGLLSLCSMYMHTSVLLTSNPRFSIISSIIARSAMVGEA